MTVKNSIFIKKGKEKKYSNIFSKAIKKAKIKWFKKNQQIKTSIWRILLYIYYYYLLNKKVDPHREKQMKG